MLYARISRFFYRDVSGYQSSSTSSLGSSIMSINIVYTRLGVEESATSSNRDPGGFWSNGYSGDMRIYVRAVGVVVDLHIPTTMVPRYRAVDGMRLWRGRTASVSIGGR
jgi:hypothetical protein